MKHRKNIIFLFLLLLAWLLPVTAAANTTTLSTSVPTTVSLTVEINGKGTVWVDDQKLTKTNTISIPRNQDVSVTIQAGNGYRLASVSLNDADVGGKIRSGKLTLDGMAFDGVLSVRFAKYATVLPGENPPTGDKIVVFMLCCSMSMMTLFLILKKKRT